MNIQNMQRVAKNGSMKLGIKVAILDIFILVLRDRGQVAISIILNPL